MKIKLNSDFECRVCGKHCKSLQQLSPHLKSHNLTSLEYTLQYLLPSPPPTCKCGCGTPCIITPYKYDEYRSGHNPDCFWQFKLDKESQEYKEITAKISKSVTEYAKDNPREVTDEERRAASERMTKWISDNPEAAKDRSKKMQMTKQKQGESGELSRNHWTKTWDIDAVEAKLMEMGRKSSATKRERYANGDIVPWNKGLDSTDHRVSKISGPNNYRYNGGYAICNYSRKFRNKEYRRLLLEQQNNVCFCCENVDGRQLCLHHIDENKQNDAFDNLIFVCRSCHIRIHNAPILMKKFTDEVVEFKLRQQPIELNFQNNQKTE